MEVVAAVGMLAWCGDVAGVVVWPAVDGDEGGVERFWGSPKKFSGGGGDGGGWPAAGGEVAGD
nr:hypothetical protein [Tanacetum cinerariifolium]